MALELNKLAGQVQLMGQSMAERRARHMQLIREARAQLAAHSELTEEFLLKIKRAHDSDASWRGAEPLGSLNERHFPATPPQAATIIATDGSQIYPDRHGIATYYLLNTGSIVLRQGSGQAPRVHTQPAVFFEDRDLYDESGRLRDTDYINHRRQRCEIEELVSLAEMERTALGGDISRPVIALSDGPLLPWLPQRAKDEDMAREVEYLASQFDRFRRARAVPVGYIDRPGSAYVLRTVELAEQPLDSINRATVRRGKFRLLTDRLLFADLEPNQRTGLFASTSEINQRFARAGHRVAFFYANMSGRSGPEHAVIARIELPEWAAGDQAVLDGVQQALYADCALGNFPYVLARAHELAVIGTAERMHFEDMVAQAMLHCGMLPATSAKAEHKRLTGSKGRR